MTDRKTIAIAGATGAQGGGLARAILADPDGGFAVRALTRNPDSEAARALADAGAEVVAADLGDADSVRRAFDGAHGAFCVTFYWEHMSPETEQAHAKTLAQAAADAGVRHAIWSTLDDTRDWMPAEDERMPMLMGDYRVPHFDAKGESNHWFSDLGVPTTFLNTSFYWDNLIHFGLGPQRGDDGRLAITLPLGTAKMPGIAVDDIGRAAYAIFRAGPGMAGETIGIAGEHVSGAEMAEKLGRFLGEPVGYNDVPPEVYRGFGFPGADDMGNMFQFKRDFEADYRARRSVEATRRLVPDLLDFDGWLAAYGEQIPIG